MDTESIIGKYYKHGSLAWQILTRHSNAVVAKAVGIARQQGFTDVQILFIQESASLHDIGIFYTNAPDIGCFGDLPYLCHGFKGHDLLLAEGLPRHALVCERHTGTGLTLADVRGFNGLLPERPMVPVTREEILIAYCDKFFSKDPERLDDEKSFDEAHSSLLRFGADKAAAFEYWHHLFTR